MEPDQPEQKPTTSSTLNNQADASQPSSKEEEVKAKIANMFKYGNLAGKKGQKSQHKFWNTQPVLQADQNDTPKSGPLSDVNKVEQVRKEPYDLPAGFKWVEINLDDPNELSEFYTLLTENYVEDDDNTFRFDYSREFLKWALTVPGYQKTWIVGVRMGPRLVASITGVPVHVSAQEHKLKMAEINFLCVHKDIRDKRLAPVLIKQVTRRINLRDKWQAIYTAGKFLPTPFTQARYWHRSLNPKKLVQVRFSGLGPKQTISMLQKLYKLPEETTIPGLRPMLKKDISGVFKLYNTSLEKYKVKFRMTEEEIKHYFMPIPKVIYSYVVEKDKKITDFISFYNLPSHVMKCEKHNMLNACYSFYNFATTVPFEELIHNALILAKKQNFDVYNCLDIMENSTVFDKLHFMVGDGHLNYYLYNWVLGSGKITPQELAVVLV